MLSHKSNIEKFLSVTKNIITNESSILAAVHMIVDGQQVPDESNTALSVNSGLRVLLLVGYL